MRGKIIASGLERDPQIIEDSLPWQMRLIQEEFPLLKSFITESVLSKIVATGHNVAV